jgi:hypothetical protein
MRESIKPLRDVFHSAGTIYEMASSVVSWKFFEKQPQILRLRLPQKTRQTSLRMTAVFEDDGGI